MVWRYFEGPSATVPGRESIQPFLVNIAMKSSDSVMGFAWGLAVVWRCISEKTEKRL